MPTHLIVITKRHATSLQHVCQIFHEANQIMVPELTYKVRFFFRKLICLIYLKNFPLPWPLIACSISQYQFGLYSTHTECHNHCWFRSFRNSVNINSTRLIMEYNLICTRQQIYGPFFWYKQHASLHSNTTCFGAWGSVGVKALRCATSRTVPGSIPGVVTGFFSDILPSDQTMALESTQPVVKMSTRNIPGVKAAGA